MDTKGRLIELGFKEAGTCNCGGGVNHKYKFEGYLFYLTKTKFKVKLNGTTIKSYTAKEHLEAYLLQTIQKLFARKQV